MSRARNPKSTTENEEPRNTLNTRREQGGDPEGGPERLKAKGSTLNAEFQLSTFRFPLFRNAYTGRFRRRIRTALAPNGSSNNNPARIVLGSGTRMLSSVI
jgi:hypothetical protein